MDKKTDKKVYRLGVKFLLQNSPDVVDQKLLDEYLNLPRVATEKMQLGDVFRRLLFSAQNANMKASVIGKSIGGVENLGKVLFSFEPGKVRKKYAEDHEALLSAIVKTLKPTGKIRQDEKSLWPKYCKTILSAADFLSQFRDANEFFSWANHFYDDERSVAALPLILQAEIYGIGFPLACDFLKELGFINYGKPDVHVIKIFEELELVKLGSTNYQVLKAIVRIADNVGVSPYAVDKLFWLIGSGYFYRHKDIGNQGRIGGKRKAFISYVQSSAV